MKLSQLSLFVLGFAHFWICVFTALFVAPPQAIWNGLRPSRMWTSRRKSFFWDLADSADALGNGFREAFSWMAGVQK